MRYRNYRKDSRGAASAAPIEKPENPIRECGIIVDVMPLECRCELLACDPGGTWDGSRLVIYQTLSSECFPFRVALAHVSEKKKTETLLMRAPEKEQQPGETPTPPLPAREIAAAGQKYHQVHQFVYLGGLITEDADITLDINRRTKSLGDVLGSSPQSSSTGQARH